MLVRVCDCWFCGLCGCLCGLGDGLVVLYCLLWVLGLNSCFWLDAWFASLWIWVLSFDGLLVVLLFWRFVLGFCKVCLWVPEFCLVFVFGVYVCLDWFVWCCGFCIVWIALFVLGFKCFAFIWLCYLFGCLLRVWFCFIVIILFYCVLFCCRFYLFVLLVWLVYIVLIWILCYLLFDNCLLFDVAFGFPYKLRWICYVCAWFLFGLITCIMFMI